MDPGIYRDLSFTDYEAIEAVNHSRLKLMSICPRAYKWASDNYLDDQLTKAKNFGTALHWSILQPERYLAEVVIAPDVDRRTKEGKAEWLAFLEQSVDRTIITKEESDHCAGIAQSLEGLTAAKRFLRPADYELTLIWIDKETGLKCKARLDCYQEHNAVVLDLKTCRSALYNQFGKAIFDYGYHTQGAWYLQGCRALGLPVRHFLLLACEKEEPYLNALYRLDDEVLELARLRNEDNLRKVSACQAANQWPGLDNMVQDISLPEWAKKQLEAYGR